MTLGEMYEKISEAMISLPASEAAKLQNEILAACERRSPQHMIEQLNACPARRSETMTEPSEPALSTEQ